MIKRILLAASVVTLAAGGYAFAQSAHAPAQPHAEGAEATEAAESGEAEEGGAALQAQARVTPDQAQAVALQARPGEVKDHELEREAGGSGLRYTFDIFAGGKTFEVGVDAQSGAVLENAEDTGKAD